MAEDGTVVLPLSILAQAGLDPGSAVLAVSGHEDGYVVLRRLDDAHRGLLAGRPPS